MKTNIKAAVRELFPAHEKEIEALIPFLQIKTIKTGQMLVDEGEKLSYIGFILKGALRKFYRNHSKDGQTLCFSFERSVVAEMQTLLHNRPAIYCIQALEETKLIIIPVDKIEHLTSRFSFLQNLNPAQLERAYTQELERLVKSTCETAEYRYKDMMMRQPDIIRRIPGHYIASYLGIRPESLSRIRKNLAS